MHVSRSAREVQIRRVIRRLPEDLSALGDDRVHAECEERDERVTRLFRRWPKLSSSEMTELRRLSDERQRLAKYLGTLRRLGLRRRRPDAS